jgi:tRNA threonylcarbamoyladenosine biosynthesis protein TsaB
MAFILSIETSTPVSSIAIHHGGNLIASQSIHKNKTHSKYLIPSIRFLCEASGLSISDIEAVAVSQGPGSYTGLRIGTSSAKGLCFGLDAKLIAINTLQAMARGIAEYYDDTFVFCPMLDARRMEVYSMLLQRDGKVLKPTSAIVVEKDSFKDILKKQKVVFFGDGADKCQSLIGDNVNAYFLRHVYPSAEHIGLLAWQKFEKRQYEDLAYFEPFYLKDFIAKKPSAKKLV